MHIVKNRVSLNIVANYISFIFIAISGVILNILTLNIYGVETLGKLNLILSIILIASQVSVGGIQFSILKHNSYFSRKRQEYSKSTLSALLLTFIVSTSIVTFGQYAVHLIDTDKLNELNLTLISIGIVLFSVNKVLLASLNAIDKVSYFAMFNSLRYLFIIIVFSTIYYFNMDRNYIPYIFIYSEIALFLTLILYKLIFNVINITFIKLYWIKRHFFFGLKSFIGGALIILNTKIDLLLIWFFLGYKEAGIYSFASMIAEGYAQLFMVIKSSTDASMGKLFYKSKFLDIKEIIRTTQYKYTKYIVLFGISIIALYYPVMSMLFDIENSVVEDSFTVLIILIISMMLSAKFRGFFGLLNQFNKPKLFSKIVGISTILNITISYILMQYLGIYGVAIGTAITFFIESLLLYFMAIKLLK